MSSTTTLGRSVSTAARASRPSATIPTRQLDISVRTAEFHKARLMKALGAHSVADLIHYAVRHGLISG